MKKLLLTITEAVHAALLNSYFSRVYSFLFINPKRIKKVTINGTLCRFVIGSNYINYYVSNFDNISDNESATLSFFQDHIRDGDVLYDVGANIGAYCVWFANAFACKSIVGFEPEAENFAALVRNLRINRVPNAIALPIAASQRAGYSELLQTAVGEGSASAFLSYYEGHGADVMASQTVRTERIDALVAGGLILPPDMVLVDVDGGELAVLRGMKSTLDTCRAIVVEVADETESAVDKFLAGHGFEMTLERNQRRGNRIYQR